MGLKELKALLDAAAAELAKKPDDEALKAAHTEAKSKYDAALVAAQAKGDADGEGDDGDPTKLDVSTLDPKAQKLIKDLRKENADARKRNKNLDENQGKLRAALVEAGIIEGDDGDPETAVKSLKAQNEQAVFHNAILESAVEYGVGKADLKYFRFLVQEKVAELKDGEELGDDDLAELAKQAKRPAASASTSVTGGEGGEPPPKKPGASGDVSLEQFAKMNTGEKSALYLKNADLYNQLHAEAKSKKMLLM